MVTSCQVRSIAALALCVSTAAAHASFISGKLFLSSSVTDEVRIYDAETLAFDSAFTHPSFDVGVGYQFGPNGLAFNSRGNLVVAARSEFVEFSAPGVAFGTSAKQTVEGTENVIFDAFGNLYTTTSTGGSNQLNQYADTGTGYVFAQTIALPSGAGQLTGITFDAQGRLFVASQSDDKIHVLQASADFSTFSLSHSIAELNQTELEGLQFNQNGELIAAGGNIVRYDPDSGAVLGSFDAPGDLFPVPLTVDNLGRIYVADYENGSGTAPADIFRFTPDGASFISVNDPGLFGPFGFAISGTALPGGPPVAGGVPEPETLVLLAGALLWVGTRRRG